MVVIMQAGVSESQVEAVIEHLNDSGFDVHRSSGNRQTVLGAIGVQPDFDILRIEGLDGVDTVHRVTDPNRFASREWQSENTVIRIADLEIGGSEPVVMAGPRRIESEEQIHQAAERLAACGVSVLRVASSVPTPHTPSIEALGLSALTWMRNAADSHGLLVMAEVNEKERLDSVLEHADIVVVSAQKMSDFSLLREIGKADKPVVLTRGIMSTIDEWLFSANYVLSEGNSNVILCDAGVRTFDHQTGTTIDPGAIAVVLTKSHLPVLIDPGYYRRSLNEIVAVARAAVAAGANGLMIETHPESRSETTGPAHSLHYDQLSALLRQIGQISNAVDGLNHVGTSI